MYLDQFTHHNENPHSYQNVRNEIFFHFHYKSSTHAISRLRKIEKTITLELFIFEKSNFCYYVIWRYRQEIAWVDDLADFDTYVGFQFDV